MPKKTIAENLVKYLEHRKVEYIFGLCGHTNIAVLSALAKSNIEFVTVRHEQIVAMLLMVMQDSKESFCCAFASFSGLTNSATGVAALRWTASQWL